ncbi:sulfite exporter TauE/SafE family protein [Marinibactrum halimedae]|nr:sulfite exporter TauE/SafE family protein [Marinibactrum halimedae]MCD9459973.1 sulfite exporter TauE/SafE family protein [Marinibactrum halimedae]
MDVKNLPSPSNEPDAFAISATPLSQRISLPLIVVYVLGFCAFYSAILTWNDGTAHLIQEYWYFFFLGLCGALVANSTGAGGGIIFIPFFATHGFTPLQAVATSMAIQCCGMTAGSVSWLNKLQKMHHDHPAFLSTLKMLCWWSGISTIAGVLVGQYAFQLPPSDVSGFFRWFSIVFGIALFAYTLINRTRELLEHPPLEWSGTLLLIVAGFFGGMVTAWISVGVGECIALLMFFLRFHPSVAVAMGVFTSAIAVLTGIIQHTWVVPSVSIEVFLFAGQAAFVGGYVARLITQKLGGFNLKLFFALWILVTGLFME